MAKTIRAGKWLQCGCCGEDFKTWQGYKDQDQDAGYGICASCQDDQHQRTLRQLDEMVALIKANLSKETLERFNTRDIDWQRDFAFRMFEKGAITMSFGSR